MRVAITGARGFIGRAVSAQLSEAGHDVVGIGRDATGVHRRLVADGLDVPQDDEAGRGGGLAPLFAGCDAVVHLAARSVDRLDTPLTSYLAPNVALTEEVALAAIAAAVPRVVFASSRMVYPSWWGGPEQMLREDCPHDPDSFYGMSKLFAERILALHADRSSLTTVALRIAQVTGPGDGGRGALPRMVEQARTQGSINVTGSGAAVRDFVAVPDLVEAIERALVVQLPKGESALVANIGTGGFSIRELAEEVARQTGVAPEHLVFEPALDEDRTAYRLDCTVAADALGWRPRRGLVEMVRERLEASAGRTPL